MDPSIRVATTEDAPALRSIYAPFVESTPVSFEEEPPTAAEMADRIETALPRHPWLVCETDDGDVVGYAAAGPLRSTPPYRWTVELTVYVADGARGSGVGTALYTSLLAVLERQGYRNAYAAVTLPNPASVRLHERLGFEPVGTFPGVGFKHGDWHDVQWWHRQVAERSSDPEPPRTLASLRESSRLASALEAGEARFDA